jgi:hypothetical protein
MPEPRAYIETTIVADVLLKPGNPKCSAARLALKRYGKTFLPVYAIKEWKAGVMKHYAYFHGKLVQTKSLARTVQIISALPEQYHRYRKSTSLEALATAIHLAAQNKVPGSPFSVNEDEELADRYRLAIAGLLIRAWRKRRDLATETIQDLDCYTESPPRLNAAGVFDLSPMNCDEEKECDLAAALREHPDLLRKMAEAIPASSTRREDVKRRQVLKDLARLKHYELTPERCRMLGDAVFAFFAPPDCVVLTTNLKDLGPLAKAIGKTAVCP